MYQKQTVTGSMITCLHTSILIPVHNFRRPLDSNTVFECGNVCTSRQM